MTAPGIDQLLLSHSYFNSPLRNARGCDLFNSSRCAHTHTHTDIRASGRHQGMMGRGFFISDWAVPTHSPKDMHTPALGGVSICSPDSSLPVEIRYVPHPGARPKSINAVYVMNGCRCQGNSGVN